MISSHFVKLWEPHYDAEKYPVDFYLRHSDSARNTEQPEQLKEDLLALLHWKDGKALAFVPGVNRAKPNTVNPIFNLADDRLADFARLYQDFTQANENDVPKCMESLRRELSDMWKTVVIPAFLLHVARPDRLPIIDQHTVRAFLALTRGEVVDKPTINWDLWRDYVDFFQKAVVAAGYDRDLKERCYVDRALFAWGKSLKAVAGLKSDVRTPPRAPSSQIEVPKTGIIPSACNVLKALEEYLDIGALGSLPQYKKQNLRDLQFHEFQQSLLRELLQNPGGEIARQLLQYYREEMGGGVDVRRLPRPILDVFLVGWASLCGIHETTKRANHLHSFGFGGTRNAAMAAVSVGKSTGQLFGLLDDSGAPTSLFKKYFGL
jgi:hypothetical protein